MGPLVREHGPTQDLAAECAISPNNFTPLRMQPPTFIVAFATSVWGTPKGEVRGRVVEGLVRKWREKMRTWEGDMEVENSGERVSSARLCPILIDYWYFVGVVRDVRMKRVKPRE